MLWIGGLWPRQVHGPLAVLLRAGRPANATTARVRVQQQKQTQSHREADLPGGCLCHGRGSVLQASLTVAVLVEGLSC